MQELRDHKFINWSKNIQSRVSFYLQPESEEEVIEIVKKYNNIRMVGTGHSWSDICRTNGVIINLDRMTKILHIDREKKQVRVQAGIKMWQLNYHLGKEGLALENQGSIDQQSIAGAVSTGTHGSGIKFGILGNQWVEFTLIKADGSKLVINREKDPELFNAAVVNLGCLGVITEVVLQAVEAFNLHDVTASLPFDEIIENLDELVNTNDHLKLWWLPPTDEVVVYRYRRTNEKRNDSRFRRYFMDEVFSVAAYRSLVFGAKTFPKYTKAINRFLTSQMKRPLDRIEICSKVFIVPEPPLHLETEWAFDISRAKDILRDYKKLLTENEYKMSFIQEIRFTKGDEFWLSGCHGRDSIWLGVYCYKHENFDDKLKEFEKLAVKYDGRPHWGKLFNVGRDYLEKQYPKYRDFEKLRKEFDPTGKFANNYIKRYFD